MRADADARRVSPGFEVPRRDRPFVALSLRAWTLAAALVVAGQPAGAQPASDSEFMSPSFDGGPQQAPRFRASGRNEADAAKRFGQLPKYGYQAPLGAGTTGFDSSNTRKGKPKPKAAQSTGTTTPATPSDPASTQTANAGTTGQPKPAAAPKADPTPPPKLLQPATNPLAFRLRNRPGSPATTSDGVIATIATTPPSRLPLPEEKPFDPLGIQVGAFNFRPALEYTRGYDTNPSRVATGSYSGSWLNIYASELLVNSNWGRHELTANLRGNYTTYDTLHSEDRPTADGRINGRIDVTSQSRIDLEGRFIVGTDRPGSPNIQADLARLPIFLTIGASAGVGQRFNRLEVTLKGLVDRTAYQPSTFIDGSTESNDDRNYHQYGGQLRTSYVNCAQAMKSRRASSRSRK